MTSPVPVTADTSPESVIRWTFDRLNAHDSSSLRQLYDDESVSHFPQRVCRGADEIVRFWVETFTGMPDFHVEILTLAGHGDDVFVHWRMTATHRGTLQGIAPTGKAIALEGMDHFVVREGRIRTGFVAFDQMEYARQLGMVPPDGSPADRLMKRMFNARTQLKRRLRG
ncbi:ester cyclase [Geodermatophilus sp. SYSU D00696]